MNSKAIDSLSVTTSCRARAYWSHGCKDCHTKNSPFFLRRFSRPLNENGRPTYAEAWNDSASTERNSIAFSQNVGLLSNRRMASLHRTSLGVTGGCPQARLRRVKGHNMMIIIAGKPALCAELHSLMSPVQCKGGNMKEGSTKTMTFTMAGCDGHGLLTTIGTHGFARMAYTLILPQ